MPTISVSAQIMFDLFLMCCVWDWEIACKKAGRKENDTVRPVRSRVRETVWETATRKHNGLPEPEHEDSPFKYHRTTVDKVLKVLRGLQLLTELQVKSMRTDRELQNIFYRRCKQMHLSHPARHDLVGTKELLIYTHDMRTMVNKKRLTRDVFYYPTASGQEAGRNVAERYKGIITKDAYYAEVKRINEWMPTTEAGHASAARKYQKRVRAET